LLIGSLGSPGLFQDGFAWPQSGFVGRGFRTAPGKSIPGLLGFIRTRRMSSPSAVQVMAKCSRCEPDLTPMQAAWSYSFPRLKPFKITLPGERPLPKRIDWQQHQPEEVRGRFTPAGVCCGSLLIMRPACAEFHASHSLVDGAISKFGRWSPDARELAFLESLQSSG
jgi:hypothetical protein